MYLVKIKIYNCKFSLNQVSVSYFFCKPVSFNSYFEYELEYWVKLGAKVGVQDAKTTWMVSGIAFSRLP